MDFPRSIFKIFSIVIILVSISGCNGQFSSAPSDEFYNSNLSDKDYDICFYNSQIELDDKFKDLCSEYETETGVKIKTISENTSENIPTIISVRGTYDLSELTRSGLAMNLSDATENEFKEFFEKIPKNLRLVSEDGKSYGIPYGLAGDGYFVDKQVISEMFSVSKTEQFIKDMKSATYYEFKTFVDTVSEYIKNERYKNVTIKGNTYQLSPLKTDKVKNIKAMFHEPHYISTMNVAVAGVFASQLDAQRANFDQIKNVPFKDFAQVISLQKSSISNDGAAFFLSRDEVLKQNENKNFVLFPIKFPIQKQEIKVSGLNPSKINSSIAFYVPRYYVINAKSSEKEKKLAENFLVWLNKSEVGKDYITNKFKLIPYMDGNITLNDLMQMSALEYNRIGDTIPNVIYGFSDKWLDEISKYKITDNYNELIKYFVS